MVPEEAIKNNFGPVTQPFDGRLTSQAGTGVPCPILVLRSVSSEERSRSQLEGKGENGKGRRTGFFYAGMG